MAQRVLERKLGRLGVGADLALVHHRALVLEQELDRVLNRENVARCALVAVIQHGRQGGAFAGAGGAHHQHQAPFFHDQFAQDHGHRQRGQRRNIHRDEADHRRKGAALAHGTDAEPAHTRQRPAHVELIHFFQFFDAVWRQYFCQQMKRRIGRKNLAVDGHALPIDPDQRGRVG